MKFQDYRKLERFLRFQAALSKEMLESIKKVAQGCAKKEGATIQDVAQVLVGKTESNASKCLLACIGETMKIVSSDFSIWDLNHSKQKLEFVSFHFPKLR